MLPPPRQSGNRTISDRVPVDGSRSLLPGTVELTTYRRELHMPTQTARKTDDPAWRRERARKAGAVSAGAEGVITRLERAWPTMTPAQQTRVREITR